jgi:hypothetical protein
MGRYESFVRDTKEFRMNTLMTPPLAPLLAQLFSDAEATTAKLFQQLSPEEIEAFKGKGDYRELYGRMKDYHLAVSKDTGVLLYMLARSTGARAIIEFGTFIWHFHAPSCCRSQGQRGRPPHHHRVRTV